MHGLGFAELDDTDRAICAERERAFNEQEGPRVGDFVDFPGRITRRISYIWPSENGPCGMQTSEVGAGYYLGNGYVNMGNGSLYVSIPEDTLTETGETRAGSVWFFHHNRATAHNGIDTQIMFRVYTCSVEAPRS